MSSPAVERYPVFALLLSALLFLQLTGFGCATNPVTQKKEFMIVSEKQEFSIGRQVDKQVREEVGVYIELPRLRNYVKDMATAIGQSSDRTNIIYRIEILDSPEFNAFALPGGFVYAYRGLLERVNSADELASVIGHEIAHVAARHSAAQMSRAQLMNIGLLGASVATGGVIQDYGGLVNIASALAFSKFSRDDEREADYYGTLYMMKAGYNPLAALSTMEQIQRIQIREPSALESWFMTHPPTEERIENLTAEIQELQWEDPAVLQRPIRRNGYLALLDGMVVGEWNGNELVSGNRYYNKEFLLSMEIPRGWYPRINNSTYTAVFLQLERDFSTFFRVEPLMTRQTTEEYAREYESRLGKLGLRKTSEYSTDRILEHGASAGIFSGRDRRMGSIIAEGISFVKDTSAYTFLGVCKDEDFVEFQALLESMANSLEFITQEEASSLKPPRLTIHEVAEGETWKSIMEQYFGSDEGMEKIAEYNGLDATKDLTPGTLVKIPPSSRFR